MLRFRDIVLGTGPRPGECRLCTPAPESPVPVFRPAEEILADLAAHPGEIGAPVGVRLTGADPLAHPDPPSLVAAAVRTGAQRVALDTPGEGLARPGAADALLAAGARVFEVALLGSTEATHDRLAARSGSFDALAEGLAAVASAAEGREARVFVRARVTVCPHTVADLPATVMRCAELGASQVVLVAREGVDPRRALEWIGAACDTGTVNRLWVSVSGVPAEALGERGLHAVDPFEAVHAGSLP